MLEQSHNTAQKSYTLREACHYKREFGGRIYAIQQEACHYQREVGGRIYAIQQEIKKIRNKHGQYLLHLKHHQ